jgi:hypothetical protein
MRSHADFSGRGTGSPRITLYCTMQDAADSALTKLNLYISLLAVKVANFFAFF